MSSDLSGITRFFTTDPQELIALKRRVMNDMCPPPGSADAIYCVGGTVDTQEQSVGMSAMLCCFEYAPNIGVLRATTQYGYCGFEFGRDMLIARGVPEMNIVPVDILPEDADTVNTYTEMKALVRHARVNGWKTIIICAPYFHQIRASATLISQLNPEHPDIWIFNRPAAPPDFREKMKHSQGVVEGDLMELLILEFSRLFRYHDMRENPIYSCRNILGYYDRRDRAFAL